MAKRRRRSRGRRWIRRGFLVWAVVSTVWFTGKFRTRGVAEAQLASDDWVAVRRSRGWLRFWPTVAPPEPRAGLVFIVGGGVAPEAYAPLLRPIAEEGHAVVIVGLPYRIAPLESHKQTAVARAAAIIADDPAAERWVLAGHSQGGAIACRVASVDPDRLWAMVLLGTSHPRRRDLSSVAIPVTKVVATNDGVATPEQIAAAEDRLPMDTRWVVIEGGNHSQFGHYGHQLFDGEATISREEQQAQARTALLDALRAVYARLPPAPVPTDE